MGKKPAALHSGGDGRWKDNTHQERMHFKKKINVHFKQNLRILKFFQNLPIIVGHEENASACNRNRMDTISCWKNGKKKKKKCCIAILLPHLICSRKRYVSNHPVQPVKSLYLCKYLFYINAAATFNDFCYLYCLSFNARALTVPDLGPVGLQNAGLGGEGVWKGTGDKIQSKNK